MWLNLYSFSKRKNSTKRPDIAAGLAFDPVYLKKPTSFNRPTFQIATSAAINTYNYAMFEDVCYFITDCRCVANDRWEIDCEMDYLATARNNIIGSSVYAEYITAGNSNILDSRLTPTADYTVRVADIAFPGSESGTYVVGAVGDNGVAYYAMNEASLRSLMRSLSGWAEAQIPAGGDLIPAFTSWAKHNISRTSASSCLRSCLWLPFVIYSEVMGSVMFGDYNSGVTGYIIDSAVTIRKYGYGITIPYTRSGWLRLHPFTETLLYIPFIGTIALNNPILAYNNKLNISVCLNQISGELSVMVECGGAIIGTYGASTACDYGVGESSIKFGNVFTSAIAGVGSAAYGNIAGAVGAAANAIVPTTTTIGGCSGSAGYGLLQAIRVSAIEHGISGNPSDMADVQGIPCFKRVDIPKSGYIQTRNASITGTYRSEILDEVNNLLNSGIYIE